MSHVLSSPAETEALRVMEESSSIQGREQLVLWLRGEFQRLLPHQILVSVSGDFEEENLYYDIVSSMPGVRAGLLKQCAVRKFCQGIYRRWLAAGGEPIDMEAPGGFGIGACNLCHYGRHCRLYYIFQEMQYSLIHAITDARFKVDRLYIFLGQDDCNYGRHKQAMTLLLPHLDAAMRKLEGPPEKGQEQAEARNGVNSLLRAGMSHREIEILEWVCNGKTNIEIGMILNISAFTVKNHLQRIFKKMNVSNRAQAVSKLGRAVYDR